MKNIYWKLFYGFMVCILLSCHSKNTDKHSEEITPQEILAFATNLENKVMEENPLILNQLLLKDSILKKARYNDRFAACIDSDMGMSFYNRAVDLSTVILNEVKKGGEYKFVEYYVEKGVYHLIYRTYSDFSLKIDDYTIQKVNDSLRIKDVYLYNFGQNLSDYVIADVLYNVDRQDENKNICYMDSALNKLKKEDYKSMLNILRQYKTVLSNYPYYDNLYLMALYNVDKTQYIPYIDSLKLYDKDNRYIILQEYSFYMNERNIDKIKEISQKLITHTGKDVIYDFLLAEVYHEKQQNESAEQILNQIEGIMNPIWDYWNLKLNVYYALNNETLFRATLLSGKDLYAYTNKELEEILKTDFPKYSTISL